MESFTCVKMSECGRKREDELKEGTRSLGHSAHVWRRQVAVRLEGFY